MVTRIDGWVDPFTFTPKVTISIISSNREINVPAMIDTGYNGEIILPISSIRDMNLEFLGTIDSELANGEIVDTELYKSRMKWFNEIREITVGASQSEDILLGTLLLANCRLEVDFKQRLVSIEKLI